MLWLRMRCILSCNEGGECLEHGHELDFCAAVRSTERHEVAREFRKAPKGRVAVLPSPMANVSL